MKKPILILFLFCFAFAFDKTDFSTIKSACENENIEACYLHAWLYYNESDMSNEKTKTLLSKLCEETKHAKSCNALASDFFKINKKKYYKKACDLGYLEACYSLAKLEDDCDLIKSILLKANSKLNDEEFLNNYLASLIYIDGKCVKQNTKKAQELSKPACLKGNLNSCEIYHRTIFENTKTIKSIIANAHEACAYDLRACSWLIQVYRYGFLSQPKDYDMAAKIALDGCARADANTCFTIIDLAKRGYKIDLEKVKEQMQKGCLLGNEKMCNFIQGR